MPGWVSHLCLPKRWALIGLVLGLGPWGCAQQPGTPPFRFWGYSTPAEVPADNSRVSKRLGEQSASDSSKDPFLALNIPSSETPADHSGSPAENAPPAANPVQVVQHQKPVSDISSAEAGDALPQLPGGSRLDRLKYALSRDAKTQVPQTLGSDASEVARQRVEGLMKNARRQIQLGEYVSALRWAMAAEQLAARSDLFYGPDEDPPADLVRILQDRLKVPPAPMPAPVMRTSEPSAIRPDSPDTPEFSIDVPEIEPRNFAPQVSTLAPDIGPSQLHSTRAMQKAVIAPETLTAPEKPDEPWTPPVISPSQRHARSLKVDARRVSANEGARVSVEGQLNPPAPSRRPELPLAPPVRDDIAELPPLDVVMSEPGPIPSTTPPPLPPPTVLEQSPPAPAPFLYADNDLPAPEPKRNVHWDETDPRTSANERTWWIFPAMVLAGMALLGFVLLRRKRG